MGSVLAGSVRDPLVGRDVLIGCATGVTASCLTALNRVVAWRAGNPAALLVPDWFMMNGTSSFIGAVLAGFATALYVSLFMLFFYFLIAGGTLRTFTLVRIGLVAEIVGAFVWTLFAVSPMTLQSSA